MDVKSVNKGLVVNRKVVQIVRSPEGGIRKHILSIIEGLQEENFEFYLITNEQGGDIKYFRFLDEYPQFKIRVLNLPIVDQPNWSDVCNLYKVFKYLKNIKPDVVHGHGAKGGLYARIVGKLIGAKVIYTAHGGSLHSMFGIAKSKIYAIVEKALYYATDALVFESKYSMTQYANKVHRLSPKFELNYNGIEFTEKFSELKPREIDASKEILLGAFGLLRPLKGHKLLIQAAHLLTLRGINVKVNIFGEGEERESLLALATDLGVQDIISISGYIDNVNEEIERCDIIVHPSYIESFGYVPLEAIRKGVPVIASLNGGLKEVLDDGRLQYPIYEMTPEAIADQVQNILNEGPHLHKVRKTAFEFCNKHFNEDTFLTRFVSIYDK